MYWESPAANTPAITFGWPVNVWGVGNPIHTDNDGPSKSSSQTTNYLTSLSVFDDQHRPQFLAVDHFDAEELTLRGYGDGHNSGPLQWRRAASLTSVPPWSRPALAHDAMHWDTGGRAPLGDDAIATDLGKINPKVFTHELNPALVPNAKNVKDLCKHGEQSDLSRPAHSNLLPKGIFAMLLGGSSPAGIIRSTGQPGPWVRNKLNEYV